MPLPILQSHNAPSNEDLVRLFHRTERHWTAHIAEEAQLDVGTAYTNRRLDRVYDANRILDASLPPGRSPEQAMAEVEAHFAGQGVCCSTWIMNPAAAPEQTAPLVEHLLKLSYQPVEDDIMYLAGRPAGAIEEVGGLTIIPARASFRHARAICTEEAEKWNEPQLVEARMEHLDDPHYDAMIALKDGRAVAMAGVLGVGEVGAVQDVYVSTEYRRQGIALTMMSRALEICARSLYKHVLLYVASDNTAAKTLYERVGFRTIGAFRRYCAPGIKTAPDQPRP